MAWLSAPLPTGVPDYQALGLLGQGASGQVFKARQRSTGQFVAIKMAATSTDAATQRRMRQRLHRETRVLAMLQHARIVRLIDKGLAGKRMPFAVMEYVPGVTLRDFLRQRGPLSVPDTVELMAQLLDALACLNMHDVVHRDLKPENVMVTSVGTAMHLKLLDFGIASQGDAARVQLDPAGTPAYCAPEQLRGERCTPASDIYAWALMFAECLGTAPLVKPSHPGQPLQHRRWQSAASLPQPLRDTALAPLLLRALHEDMRLRAGDAVQLYAELRHCINPAPIAALRLAPWIDPVEPLEPAQAAATATLEPAQDACTGQAQASPCAVLCLAVRLHPAPDTGMALASLQALREQQLRWCMRAVQAALGQSAGHLGDYMVFHFDRSGSGLENLRQAATLAQGICQRLQGRSRMLEFQHGVRLEISGGMHAATSIDHGAGMAIYLNGLAAPGSIVLSHSAHQGLAGSLPTQVCFGTGLSGAPLFCLSPAADTETAAPTRW